MKTITLGATHIRNDTAAGGTVTLVAALYWNEGLIKACLYSAPISAGGAPESPRAAQIPRFHEGAYTLKAFLLRLFELSPVSALSINN